MNDQLQRKKPAQRAFTGLVGSAFSMTTPEPETKKRRGRPTKFANDEERKLADAARKRVERADAAQVRKERRVIRESHTIIAAHPDRHGGTKEISGGNGSGEMGAITDKIQATQKSLGGGDSENWVASDRRKIEIPISPDDTTNQTNETESSFVNAAMRQQQRELRRWVKGKEKKPRCSQDHQALADSHHTSKVKVHCACCKKLLVNPGGKQPKGIQPYTQPTEAGNILDGPLRSEEAA